MRVKDLMSSGLAIADQSMTLLQMLRVMAQQDAEEACILAGKQIEGIFSKTAMLKILAEKKIDEITVMEVLERDFMTLPYDLTIRRLEQDYDLHRYPFYIVVNVEDQPVGVLKTSDVQRYLSENTLSQAVELQAVLNSVYNGVIAVNAEGSLVLFNAAAELITGMTAEDVIGHNINDVLPNTCLNRVLETGVAELNQQQNIGRCKIVTNRTPIINAGNVVGAVAVFQDITELQAAAVELESVKSLKSTLESAIESIFEGIVIVDRDGVVTMINQSYCEFLGVEAVNVIGQYVADVIPNTRMHVVAQGGKAEIANIQRINEHNCVVTRIPIVKDGERVGAVGKVVFKDVKDLKVLSSKLNRLQFEVDYYKEELRKAYGGKYTFDNIIGESEKMEWTKSIAIKAAKGNSTVLVLGESGTGKELFAHAIHNDSLRFEGPFIKVNCAAVPDNLLESELFGYDEGAFTGAKKGGKPGKFELANGGTIFLDEIGDMPLAMQAKLLRVLQEKEFERVGGTKTVKVDLRVIAATNRDLEKMIGDGTFRQDLYYRLNIISLNIAPLRERTEDIPMLCTMLLKKINRQAQSNVEGVAASALQLLMNYSWPGNVRELENVLERAVNLMDEDQVLITADALPPVVRKVSRQEVQVPAADNLSGLLGDTERQAILKALETAGGNKSKAASLLGIHRSGFYQKLQKYNIK